MRQHPYSIYSSARPTRVVFVVPPDSAPELLDAIFQANYGAWGGRLRPIVPAVDGDISDVYRRLIVGSDPDIVYTYCDLSETCVKWLDRSLQPWSITRHVPRQISVDRIDYRPRLPIHPVSSLAASAEFGRVAERWHTPVTHLNSNFAADSPTRRWYARNFGELLPNLAGAPKPSMTIQNGWSVGQVLSELSHVGRPAFPGLYSAIGARFFRPRVDDPRQSYCVIIGDTVSDWLMFWNQVFLTHSYQLDRWQTLCVSEDQLSDNETLVALHAFLAKHSSRSGDGPANLYLRSTSVDQDSLAAVATKLRTRRGSVVLDASAQAEGLPPWGMRQVRDAERATFPVLDYYWAGDLDTHEQQAISDSVLLQLPPCDVDRTDDWVLDLDIEFQSQKPYYVNEKFSWRVPKRPLLPGMFLKDGNFGRVNRGKAFSCRMRGTKPVVVTSPDETDVLRVALIQPVAAMYDPDDVRKTPTRVFEDLRLSDKGGYIEGIIQLAGGLQQAESLFGNAFWRDCLLHASHRSLQQQDVAMKPILNSLRKRKATIQQHLEADRFDVLSNMILRAIREEPIRDMDLSAQWIRDRFIKQRRQFIESHPDYLRNTPDEERQVPPEGRSIEEQRAIRDLDEALQHLVNQNIFLQGVRYRCGSCGLGFWRRSSELDTSLECEGCGSTVQLQIESPWTYRLNSLVRNGVAQHGVVPVIWALCELRRYSRSMFSYLPGIQLVTKYDDASPSAELDIACISDGELVVGEVKSSAREFGDAAIRRAVEVATNVVDRCRALFPTLDFSLRGMSPDERAFEAAPDAWSPSW
jgi:DNA-directed RNA polymerase subunit RPC12/RpoP